MSISNGYADKIIVQCTMAGLPQPVFDISFGGLQIEFTSNLEEKMREKMREKTSDQILILMKDNPEITIVVLDDQTGKSPSAIDQILRKMQKIEKKKLNELAPTKVAFGR